MGELEADREVLVSARLSPGWRLQLSVTFAEGPDYNLFSIWLISLISTPLFPPFHTSRYNHLIDIPHYLNGISEMITYIFWGAILEVVQSASFHNENEMF